MWLELCLNSSRSIYASDSSSTLIHNLGAATENSPHIYALFHELGKFSRGVFKLRTWIRIETFSVFLRYVIHRYNGCDKMCLITRTNALLVSTFIETGDISVSDAIKFILSLAETISWKSNANSPLPAEEWCLKTPLLNPMKSSGIYSLLPFPFTVLFPVPFKRLQASLGQH